MRILPSLCAIVLAAIVAGCGGGGSGSSSAPQTPAAPPPYTFTPGTLATSFVEGYPQTVTLSAKQTVAFTGVAYIKVVLDTPVIDPAVQVQPNGDGTVSVQVKTVAASKPGRYTGNVTVNVCTDPNCASHLSGSPFKLPYDIEVISKDGKLTTFNLSALSALSGASDWGTFQGNAAHTGYVPVTLNAGAFNPRWKLDTPAPTGVQQKPSAVTTGGGRLYTAYGVGSFIPGVAFTAYSETDGSIAWTNKFADGTYSRANPPAYANGRVYGVAGAQETTAMYAYDASSGTQLFKSQMSSQWETYLAPTVYGASVYTNGGTYGGLFSINAVSGVRDYFKDLPQFDLWTPAIDAHGLYVYVGGKLHVIDTGSGATRDVINDPNYDWNGYQTGGAPVIGSDGVVFAGNLSQAQSNAIAAFDTLAKTVRWSVSGGYSGNPAYADGTLFAANNKAGRLEAFKEADGSLAWSWARPAGETFVSDVLVTKNLVFISTDAAIYAIDRGSHQQVWTYRASGKMAMSANGILYISGDRSITAINLR